MQTEPSLSQEPQAMSPVTPKPPKKFNYLAMILGIFLFFSCVVLAGLGIWSFRLNTNLKSTQAELTVLKGNFESLTTEKNQLTSDLNATTSELNATKTELENTKSDLENTKKDLSSAQSDLDRSKKEVSDLRANMDKAAKYVDVLDGFFFRDSSFTQHKRRVSKLNDSTLSDLLDAYEKKHDQNTFDDYVSYILETIIDLLR